MVDCPFCNTYGLAERTLETSSLALVVASNPRKTKGHLLVIPRRHVDVPWDLTAAEHAEITQLIIKYQRILVDWLGSGCDMQQNYRPYMKADGIKVEHVHYHLVPRADGDELYEQAEQFERKLFHKVPLDQLGIEELSTS